MAFVFYLREFFFSFRVSYKSQTIIREGRTFCEVGSMIRAVSVKEELVRRKSFVKKSVLGNPVTDL